MNALNGIPERLTSKQEWDIVAQHEEDGLALLVLHNLRESFYYAKGCHQSHGLDDGAVLSACYEGLSAAVKRFRNSGTRFFAYAKADIRGALCRTMRKSEVVRRVRETEQLPLEDEDDDNQQSVELSYQLCKISPCSLPEFDAIYTREEWQNLAPLLRTVLNEKERMVLELNFQGGLNLQQIADMLTFSRANIHHCKQTALKKIRNKLIDKNRYSRD